jgi:hypothetical protein
MRPDQILWLVVVLIAVGLIGMAAYFINLAGLRRRGVLGHRRTAAKLRKYAALNSYKTLSDITLELDGKRCHIDHMLIGLFGVMLLQTMERSGDYYGDAKGQTWSVAADSYSKVTVPNPLLQLAEQEAFLRRIFAKREVYRVVVYHTVVFEHVGRKHAVNISGRPDNLVRRPELTSYLNKAKFDKDTGIDIERVYQTILSCQVQK